MSAPSRAVAVRDSADLAPYRRPLPDVQLPEQGRLRLGGPQEPIIRDGKPYLRDGKQIMKMGRPLDFFRATAPYKDDLLELAKVYGKPEAIEPWESPDGQQWQTVLTASEIPIALPPYTDTLVGPRYETYNAGHYMTRQCDGRTCWVPIPSKKDARGKVLEPGRWEPRSCLCSPESPECAQVTRLKVIVLGVPARGVWRVECHGAYAARHWPAQVDQAQQLARNGRPVPATIRIEAKTGRSAVHGKSLYKVPVLRVQEAFTFGDTAGLIAAPKDEPTGPPPAEPLPPDDDTIDGEASEMPEGEPAGEPASEEAAPASTSPAWLDLAFGQLQGADLTAFTAEMRRHDKTPGAYQRETQVPSLKDVPVRTIIGWASGGAV